MQSVYACTNSVPCRPLVRRRSDARQSAPAGDEASSHSQRNFRAPRSRCPPTASSCPPFPVAPSPPHPRHPPPRPEDADQCVEASGLAIGRGGGPSLPPPTPPTTTPTAIPTRAAKTATVASSRRSARGQHHPPNAAASATCADRHGGTVAPLRCCWCKTPTKEALPHSAVLAWSIV